MTPTLGGPMRRTPMLAAAVLTLAGCSSAPGKPSGGSGGAGGPAVATSAVAGSTAPAAPSTTEQPVTSEPASTCNLPDRGDVIVRSKVPGLPADAVELGANDLQHCIPTFESLKDSSPTGAGYCTQAAWAADNPGYDVDAHPAAELRNVQVVIGDCG